MLKVWIAYLLLTCYVITPFMRDPVRLHLGRAAAEQRQLEEAAREKVLKVSVRAVADYRSDEEELLFTEENIDSVSYWETTPEEETEEEPAEEAPVVFILFGLDEEGMEAVNRASEENSDRLVTILYNGTEIGVTDFYTIGFFMDYYKSFSFPTSLSAKEAQELEDQISKILPYNREKREGKKNRERKEIAAKGTVTLEFVLDYGTDDAEIILTKDNVASAEALSQNDSLGVQDYVVSLTFDEAGKEAFAEATRDNIGKQIAIVIDGELVSAPVINEEIPDGKCIISGNFSLEDAMLLATMLTN